MLIENKYLINPSKELIEKTSTNYILKIIKEYDKIITVYDGTK